MLKSNVKKSIIFTIFLSFLFISNSSYAQSDDYYYPTVSDLKNRSYFRPHSTFGLQGGGHFTTGDDIIGNGGGVALDYKFNFHKYMGMQVNIAYNYATYEEYKNHLLDEKVFFVCSKGNSKRRDWFCPLGSYRIFYKSWFFK